MSVSILDDSSLLGTLIAFRKGDFSVRLPYDLTGVEGKVADTINEIFDMNLRLREELARLGSTVGKEGRISERAALPDSVGDWRACVESLNDLIGDLVRPSTEVARVIGAVAKGDLSQTMAIEVNDRPLKGEFLHTARIVNTMVKQLNSFA